MASSFKGGFLRDDTTGALVVSGAGGGASTLGSTAKIHKFAGQTFDPAVPALGSIAPTAGQRHLVKVPVMNPGVINAIWFELGTQGAGGGLANAFMGVHRGSDGVLISTTGDISTTFTAATGVKNPATSAVGGASQDISAESFLIVQFVIGTQAVTPAGLMRASNSTGRCNVGLTAPDYAYATGSGSFSALATDLTVGQIGTISQAGNAWWIGVGVA